MKKSIRNLLISAAAIGSVAGIGLGVAYGVTSSVNNNSNDVEETVITPGVYTDPASFYAAVGLDNGTPFQLSDITVTDTGGSAYELETFWDTTFTPYVDNANDRKSIELVDSYDIGNGIIAVESPVTGSAISLKLDNPYVGMETAEGVGGQEDVQQFDETYLTMSPWSTSQTDGTGLVWTEGSTAGGSSYDVALHVNTLPQYPGKTLIAVEFIDGSPSGDFVWGSFYQPDSDILTMGGGTTNAPYYFELVPLPTTTVDPLNQEGADIIVPYTLDYFNIATGSNTSTFSLWDGNKRLGFFLNASGTHDDPEEMVWINPADEQLPEGAYYTSALELTQTKAGWEQAGLFSIQFSNPNDVNDQIPLFDETAISDDIRPGKTYDYGKYNFRSTVESPVTNDRGYAYRIYLDVTAPQTKVYIYNPFTGKYIGDFEEAMEDSVVQNPDGDNNIDDTKDSYQAITSDTPTALDLKMPNQDLPAVIGGGLYQNEPTAIYDPTNNTIDLTYFIYLNTWGIDENNDGNPLDDKDGDGIIDEGWIEIWINPKGTTNEADYTKKILDTATLENTQIQIDGKGTTNFIIENVPPLDASNTTGTPTIRLYIPETGQTKEVAVTLAP